jgi:hypothetical protein
MLIQARYKNGAIIPDDTEKLKIKEYKAKLKDGQRIIMQWEKVEEVRTRLQQGLFHELLGRYCRLAGESIGDVKIRWKVDLGYWMPADKILSGELPLPNFRGAWADLSKVYPMLYTDSYIVFLRSEADYTRKMSSELTEYAIKHCQENGVKINDILETLAASRD